MVKRINTHGLNGTRIQSIWFGIRQRCNNPNSQAYQYYGGRGIKICERWNNILNFLEDMGHPETDMSIDRIDPNGHYCPENCRWATRSQQQSNRRNNHFIEYNGKKQTAREWAKELGIPQQTVYGRIDLGWDVEKILLPKKQIDKSGLSLGGIANGARNKSKTHCKNGHEFSEENTRKNGKNGRACLKCHSLREAKRRVNKKIHYAPSTLDVTT
jgi:hypothetical protein